LFVKKIRLSSMCCGTITLRLYESIYCNDRLQTKNKVTSNLLDVPIM